MAKSLYRMFDKNDNLLYVGMSFSPGYRLAQHSQNTVWFTEVVKITIRRFESDDLCKDAEAHAIRTESPIYNKSKPMPVAVRKARGR